MVATTGVKADNAKVDNDKVEIDQRDIPSLDRVLQTDSGKALLRRYGPDLSKDAIRLMGTKLRTAIGKNELNHFKHDNRPLHRGCIEEWLLQQSAEWLEQLLSPGLKPVFNLTGTVLHTNLGRAPLPQQCIDAIVTVSRGASCVEFDLNSGKRGNRDDHVEQWLCRLTGAEAATVVNNNAAAVLLSLNSLFSRRKVAVSRGELVEIGDSFRMPDIMSRATCELYEVGTTNRTHLKDYQAAIADGAAGLMRVHTSNYQVEGFTSEVPDRQLAEFAREAGVFFINDLGSGALVDMTRYGLPAEITPAAAIAEGAHVVTFSGDKLLGGPQCGLIVGDREAIDLIRKNPMKRALRCDKMTIAALEAILKLYANPETLQQQVPALRILTRQRQSIQETATQVLPAIEATLGQHAKTEIMDCQSQIGSGALPVDLLPSVALVISPLTTSPHPRLKSGVGSSLDFLAEKFRQLPVPVVGRIHKDRLWLDLRCLEEAGPFIQNLQSLEV